MSGEPRAYTAEETREIFLDHVRAMVDYWSNQPRDCRGRLEGLAFSILSDIDGAAVTLPSFRLSPLCDDDDREYLKRHGENWFDESVDIAGGLHEHFYKPGWSQEKKAVSNDSQIAALFVRLVEITVQEYWRLGHTGIQDGLRAIAQAHLHAHEWGLSQDESRLAWQVAEYVIWGFGPNAGWFSKEGPKWMKRSG